MSLQLPTEPDTGEKNTYGQILKSTALIGGSSTLEVFFGVVRTKAMALLLGPTGVGLMGLYSSISDVAFSLAGMGIANSGVRQIAEAAGSNDGEAIARTVGVLRRTALLLALLGAVLLFLSAGVVSRFTFGSYQRTAGVALLSLAVFFRLVAAGQTALIQGMRRIPDLARISVLGGMFGTASTIALVWSFGEQGIVPALVTVAAITAGIAWWYGRKVQIRTAFAGWSDTGRETWELLRLGMVFMASLFLTMGAAYAVRIIVLRYAGFGAAGLYQSAWALGGLYVGFILQAMGADFYPRLTAVSRDDRECNRLVNEQAQISLLLAGPGVIATLTFAPVVIALFYSAEFRPAVDILRWICLGMMLRVIAWPVGFVVVAKGARGIFFWTEVAATVVHVGLAWVLVRRFGVVGSGAAFFGLYLWHALLIYAIVRRFTGFQWSTANLRIGLLFIPLAGLVFLSFAVLPFGIAMTFGTLAVVASSLYSLRRLLRLVPGDRLPGFLRGLLKRFGIVD